jgi:hypothetical protein
MNKPNYSTMTKRERIQWRKDNIKPFGNAKDDILAPVIETNVQIEFINENGFYDEENIDSFSTSIKIKENLKKEVRDSDNKKIKVNLNSLSKLNIDKSYVNKVYDNTYTAIITNIPKYINETEISELVSSICNFKKIYVKGGRTAPSLTAYITCYKICYITALTRFLGCYITCYITCYF